MYCLCCFHKHWCVIYDVKFYIIYTISIANLLYLNHINNRQRGSTGVTILQCQSQTGRPKPKALLTTAFPVNPEDWQLSPVTDRVLGIEQAEDEGIDLVTGQLLARGGTAELIQATCARDDAQINMGRAALEILIRKRFNN